MPTYEYICDACQGEFEKFQSIKADPITVCPSCGKEEVRRKIGTGAGILFKGGGFYETDYRSNSYNEAKKKDTESSGGTKTETKSDSSAKTEPAAPKAETPKAAEPKPAATAPAKSD